MDGKAHIGSQSNSYHCCILRIGLQYILSNKYKQVIRMINEDYNSFQLKITVSVLNKFRKCREILQQEAKQGMKVMNAYVFEARRF